MTRRYLRTSEVSNVVGVHPNTVRLYEEWGFLPPIPRNGSGYRQFTPLHVEQMRLARLALHGGWPGRAIRQSALALVRISAGGDLPGALEQAGRHQVLVQAERAQAEAAADYLQRWQSGEPLPKKATHLSVGEAAHQLDLTIDTLRSWERNGLIKVPRNPRNGYREYGAPEIGRLRIIRMLYRSGYSSMAILRMVRCLEQGRPEDARWVLDTPALDEDVLSASDRWLSTLAEQEERARRIIAQLRHMMRLANALC
jgi:DNA-binding transcriptional MerR regulator